MFKAFEEAWNKIQDDPPGKRFRRQYRRRQAAREGILKRLLFMGSGSVLGTLGLIMIFTPGPGLFFIFIGLGLIAQESLLLALWLDKFEIALRNWFDWGKEKWDRISIVLKVLMVATVLAITVLALYGAYLAFLT